MTASQGSLFDVAEATRRRDEGMALAARGKESWLLEAREVAVEIAREKGTVSADDVRAAGVETPEGSSPNVFGSLFKDPRFAFDHFTESQRPSRHRNVIRVWRLA